MQLKSIFLTNKSSLYSDVTGGVQLCSQEFLEILNNVEFVSVENYYVQFTKNFWQRVYIKLGLENYSMYNVRKDEDALIKYISENKIELVFINMASCIDIKVQKNSFLLLTKLLIKLHYVVAQKQMPLFP